MPTLYVANCTKQPNDFVYRAPDEKRTLRRQMIRPGAQEMIYNKDASLGDIECILNQHLKYGLVRVSEIDRHKPFLGLCFDIDKPIKVETYMRAQDHNVDVLQRRSRDARMLTATALHDAITRAGGAEIGIKDLHVRTTEETTSQDTGLNEDVVVDLNAPVTTPRIRNVRGRGSDQNLRR